MEELRKTNHVFPIVDWDFEDIAFDNGFILDIGGGGEGVIGQLKGKDVVAIDFREKELLEAADGPLKIIMDARDLKFLDESFPTVTAFFALMYIKEKDDQIRVFQEVARVLKQGGKFHIWEVDLVENPKTDKEFYIIHLRYKTGQEYKETGYGMRWPKYPRGMKDYLEMAEAVGLVEDTSRLVGNTFYLSLRKL